MIIVEQTAELVRATHNAEAMLERIARVCYNSEDRMVCDCADGECEKCRARRAKFLGGLKERRHDSVFEHASATFRLVTDRGITHELVRHRLASYTQSSTRYIRYDEGIPVVPPLFRSDAEEREWRSAVEAAERAYRALLDAGTPAENARDVLPTCTAATIFVTANFREWRHILRLRLAQGAHPKIRLLARQALEKLAPHCPVYFNDLHVLYKETEN
jgi:thymidylate synthase (FAD)